MSEEKIREKTIAIEGNGQRPSHKGNGYKESDKMYTLNSTEVHGVAYKKHDQYAVDFGRAADRIQMNATKSVTLLGLGGGGGAKTGLYCLPKDDDEQKYLVRRLTPVECERLQGLPDGFTDIEFKGKPALDSKRYKALGNGMAQPCADYVIKQIVRFVNGETELSKSV